MSGRGGEEDVYYVSGQLCKCAVCSNDIFSPNTTESDAYSLVKMCLVLLFVNDKTSAPRANIIITAS